MERTARPIFELWPELEPRLGFFALGDFPTPVERLDRLVTSLGPSAGETYVKRDDLSSPVYGGNKVRTLEALFGQARREGKRTIVATGAYGSNHSVATALHAPRADFRAGIMLFPQPYSQTAIDNLRVSLAAADEVTDLLHWSALPLAMWRRQRSPSDAFVMRPGGAVVQGCLGFMSAGIELARQVEQGAMPPPDEVLIALGSTCSTAGLLVGMRVAARLGIGWGRPGPSGRGARAARGPTLVAVRVTPWPLTSPVRILNLARGLSTWLFELTGRRELDLPRAELARHLVVEGSQIGKGYGLATAAGMAAIERAPLLAAGLDTTYAAKSAAELLERLGREPRVRLFWSTKSSAPLPEVGPTALAGVPPRMLRWLERARRACAA